MPHSAGRRAVVERLAELEKLEREEAARAWRAENPAPPPVPQRVVSTRRLFNPGVGEVAAGSILRASDQLVQENPGAFTSIED